MTRLLVLLSLVALMVRAAVPVGWMPDGDRAYAITICTGTDSHQIWMDGKGQLHQQDPAEKSAPEPASCAFAGLGFAAGLPETLSIARLAIAPVDLLPLRNGNVAIGQGLAAPPPPATGPPTLI